MKVGFDGSLRLELHGAKVTSDAGLLAYRDLDEGLVLFDECSLRFSRFARQIVTSGRVLPPARVLEQVGISEARMAELEQLRDEHQAAIEPLMQ